MSGKERSQTTNVEFVTDMMEYSNNGALIQAYVIEALRKYSEMIVKNPDFGKDWPEHSFVHPEAWKRCAHEVMRKIDERTGFNEEESDG